MHRKVGRQAERQPLAAGPYDLRPAKVGQVIVELRVVTGRGVLEVDLGALTVVPDIAQVIAGQAWRRAWAVPIGVQSEAVAVASVTWDRDSRAGAYLTGTVIPVDGGTSTR